MKESQHKGSQFKSILIVDDAEWHNILLKKILSDYGYGVKAFTNGYMLLKDLKREPPDLIISDIDMPEIDGFTLFKMIKELPEGADIPVIFVSSLNEGEVRSKADQNDMFYFVQKPITRQLLLDIVSQKL